MDGKMGGCRSGRHCPRGESVATFDAPNDPYVRRIDERCHPGPRPDPMSRPDWSCALELDGERHVTAGSPQQLAAAIRCGADLRILTEFRHNEHIDLDSPSRELVREVAQFAVTYLIDDCWSAGIMSLRQPVELPSGFGPRPSMSYFLYNEDGTQAIARLHLDGAPAVGVPGPAANTDIGGMAKYHCHDSWDDATNAPSSNFVYDFDLFRYCVNDRWEQVCAHDASGNIHSGSIEQLADAFADGCAVKVALSGLCADLADGDTPDHELFVEIGSGYYYTDQQLFIAGSHPVIRVAPAVPLMYRSGGWDSGWLVIRSDGAIVYRRCDPYSLVMDDRSYRCGIRWFVS